VFFDNEIGFGSVWFLAVLSVGWLGAGLRDCDVVLLRAGGAEVLLVGDGVGCAVGAWVLG
ncbi:hypothetical protein, partial [Roseomonas sp. CECT 9278]|uniref:hypothetical protein n=1 Tax=Roseomonas sp. CECT 9278 TaxID=2845823 RepID=UPI001E33E9F6